MTDTLPAGVTYSSSNDDAGRHEPPSGSTVTAALGNLATGASATITILVNVNSSTSGDITNTATVTGVEPDPNLTNNTATCTTQVDQPPVQPASRAGRFGHRQDLQPALRVCRRQFHLHAERH